MTDRDSSLPRRFVLLGEPAKRSVHSPWPSALFKSEDHEIVGVVCGELAALPTYPDWRSLLERGADFDAVLVDGDSPEAHQAMRELAARGVTLAIPIDWNLPAELVAELSLYDSEGTTTLLPLWMERFNPRQHELREMIAAGRFGEIISLEIRSERSAPTPQQWEEHPGEHRLFADIDTLRMLGGDYTQVTLMRTGVRDDRFAMQTLQLSGTGLPDGTSILDLAAEENRSRIRIEGTNSSAVWRFADGTDTLEVNGETVAQSDVVPIGDEQFLKMIDAAALRQAGAPQWHDVARAFEIMEAADRSLRRRRTIDLHFETTSERSQFKTHMATIGCGVILWTMLGIIGLLFAGAVLDPRDRLQREAEAAGFVLETDDFEPGTSHLTDAGASQLADIAGDLALSESVVIVATEDAEAPSPLDKERLSSVRRKLAEQGVNEAETRTELRPLEGAWFAAVMQIARVLVFAPVGLYLLFQLLLVVAKPPAERQAAP